MIDNVEMDLREMENKLLATIPLKYFSVVQYKNGQRVIIISERFKGKLIEGQISWAKRLGFIFKFVDGL